MLKLLRPIHLFLAALTYAFGASIANYLGVPFRPSTFWLGFVAILLAQLSMPLLSEVFRLDIEPLLENETRKERRIRRNNILYIAVSCLAIFVFIALNLFFSGALTLPSTLFLFLSLILVLVYALPPFRNQGFGELILALQLAYVIPTIAYTFQAGEPHRFLVLAIPLTLLAFANFIIADFRTFATDVKYHRVTFLTRLGWERVVPLHHLFVLLAYILFLTAPSLGLPLSLIAPAFLTLPFALFQIYQLRNISLGLPPNWTLLTATALSVFGLTTYFLTLTFWLR